MTDSPYPRASAGKPMEPLPNEMLGSRGQTIYPYGNPPNRDYHPVSSVEDTRDMRDPASLGEAIKTTRKGVSRFTPVQAYTNLMSPGIDKKIPNYDDA